MFPRIVALEREKANRLYSKKHEFRASLCALEETEVKLAAERKAESEHLWPKSHHSYHIHALMVETSLKPYASIGSMENFETGRSRRFRSRWSRTHLRIRMSTPYI